MKTPPGAIDHATTLYYISLDEQYTRTGNTTHSVAGQVVHQFAALAICQYTNERGYYLFYCDKNWLTITDTYHDTVEDAMDQAAFEYEGLTPKK